MPERESAEFRPARESSLWIVVVLVVLALGAGAMWWRWSKQQAAPAEAPPVAAAPQPDAPAPAAPPPAASAEPQHPVDATAEADLPKLDDADARVRAALAELLGGKAVASFLQVDGFVRRFVATVDNLPRDQAAARMWPVQPTPKRFEVSGGGEAQTISLDNGARYTPFVLFVESVNAQRAAALYAQALSAVPAGVRRAGLSGPLLQRPAGRGDRPPAAGARADRAAAGEAGRGQGRRAFRPALDALRVRRPAARERFRPARRRWCASGWSTSAG